MILYGDTAERLKRWTREVSRKPEGLTTIDQSRTNS